MNISSDTKTTTLPDGRISTWNGQTIQGNMDESDNNGRVQSKNGTFSIKEASMTIFLGGIMKNMTASYSNLFGLTLLQAIGAVAGHESIHAIDPSEINKDLKYESKNPGQSRPNREILPNKIKQSIIDVYKQ